MSSNGGFPPLKNIKKDNNQIKQTKVKKERLLNIKSILSDSIVKPMIDLNKPQSDKVIDTL
jgi:hypothetical protein